MENKTTNTDTKDWSKEIIKFYNSKEYQKLDEYYNRSTIFDALGIQRSETKHSKFLKWLLDPTSNHQLGDVPLKKFLMLLSTKEKLNEQLKSKFLSNSYKIVIEKIETEFYLPKSKGRIDIFISLRIDNIEKDGEKENVVIIIENKIYAKERETNITMDADVQEFYRDKTEKCNFKKAKQTILYQYWLEKQSDYKSPNFKKVYLYLTPDGKRRCASNDYIPVTYQEIVDYVIDPILFMDVSDEIKFFIREYLRALSKPSLDDDEKTIIATSNYEKQYLENVGIKFKELINEAFDKRNIDDNSLIVEEMRLKDFWQVNRNLLSLILKETDTRKYDEIKKEKTKIVYNGKQYDFSKFVWQVIKDYVDNEKIADLGQLQEMFNDEKEGTCNTRMFATKNEYKCFREERKNYWSLTEPIKLKNNQQIFVTSVWLKDRKLKNHSLQEFIKIIKNNVKGFKYAFKVVSDNKYS